MISKLTLILAVSLFTFCANAKEEILSLWPQKIEHLLMNHNVGENNFDKAELKKVQSRLAHFIFENSEQGVEKKDPKLRVAQDLYTKIQQFFYIQKERQLITIKKWGEVLDLIYEAHSQYTFEDVIIVEQALETCLVRLHMRIMGVIGDGPVGFDESRNLTRLSQFQSYFWKDNQSVEVYQKDGLIYVRIN